MAKLALGTVQFGMNYGISNTTGEVSDFDFNETLNFCLENQVDVLDTARAYGKAESRIGSFSSKSKFKIVTKIPHPITDIRKHFEESLKSLQVKRVYGLMLHRGENFLEDEKYFRELSKLRESGVATKIGGSFYDFKKLQEVVNRYPIDMVQVPFNILDQRLLEYIDFFKEKDIEIHTRSAFLQGLFFLSDEEIKKNFTSAFEKVQELKKIAESKSIPWAEFLLSFCFHSKIDYVVVGVQTKEQLAQNLNIHECSQDYSRFKIDDESVINPSLWSSR